MREKYQKEFRKESRVSLDPTLTFLDEMLEKEWQTYVRTLALNRVFKTQSSQAYEVFKLDLDGKKSEEIASSTGLALSSVYTLRKRVKKTLQNELSSVINDLGP